MTKEELRDEIKALIISALELEDVSAAEIETDAPLFGASLGLDSVDALELGMALRKKFGVAFTAGSSDNKKHFASVAALADYIYEQKGGKI